MVSRFSSLINNALNKTHAALGHTIKFGVAAIPHARSFLKTVSNVAQYVSDNGLHPYAVLGSQAILQAAKVGSQLLDYYEPGLLKLDKNYPSAAPMIPNITTNGISLNQPPPLITGQTVPKRKRN